MSLKSKVKEFFFIGGGQLLLELMLWCKKNKISSNLITSSRNFNEIIDGIYFKDHLIKNNLNFIKTKHIDSTNVKNYIKNKSNKIFISIGSPWIFTKNQIKEIFEGNLFNLHGARLPQNKGGAGFSWQILTANRFGFCLLHKVDEKIDNGEIIEFEEFLYPPTARIPLDFKKIYIEKNFKFLTNILKLLNTGKYNYESIKLPNYLSSYWPRLNTIDNGWIDWSQKIEHIERFICAFDDPYEGARTTINNKLNVFLKKVSLNFQDGSFHPFQSGLIYRKSINWICVSLTGGALIIEEVNDKNGKNIINKIKEGDRFITPLKKIESSKVRIRYSEKGKVK